jgi:hypothetical protein
LGKAGTGAGTNGDAGNAGAGAGSAGEASTGSGGAGAAGIGAAGAAGAAGVGSGTGCEVGGTTYENGASNIPAGDGCNTCSCQDGLLACTLIACAPTECVVARRLDECCGQWRPVTRTELGNSSCWVVYPGTGVQPDVEAGCAALRPSTCSTEPCVPAPPTSRIATPNGPDACVFIDECFEAQDCVLAFDSQASCCACPESVPSALTEDPRSCYRLATGTQALRTAPQDPIQWCLPCVATGTCGGCPEPAKPVCEIRGSANRCR